jgi:multiple sugar transport system ATP-binding protein
MIKNVDKAERNRAAEAALEMVKLSGYGDRRPGQLSGGQRQRVAMGRAIVRDPQVFLFDEPLSNLDAKLRVAMRSEIKELHQRLKTTSIYVTHDQIEAMTMGDRIVVMKDGRVEQNGSPLDLYDHPANMFVAGFIGSPSMNFLPGTLRRAGAESWVELRDGTRLAAPVHAGGNDGQAVVLGTRPEHLTLVDDSGIPAHVVVVEPTGAETLVLCRQGDAELAAVFRERHDFAPGSTIHLQPDLQRAHLFDADTGQRLTASTGAGRDPSLPASSPEKETSHG